MSECLGVYLGAYHGAVLLNDVVELPSLDREQFGVVPYAVVRHV
jgi:hypothetical protein